jgi:hypothetical protein
MQFLFASHRRACPGCRAAGHRVSARKALLHAANYYCTVEHCLRDNPGHRRRGHAAARPVTRDLHGSGKPPMTVTVRHEKSRKSRCQAVA